MRKRRLYKAKNEHNQTRSFYVGRDGRRHEYLNAAVPDGGDVADATCEPCGFGYTEMIHDRPCACNDCVQSAIGEYELAMAEQGIEVGMQSCSYFEQVTQSHFFLDEYPNRRVSQRVLQKMQDRTIAKKDQLEYRRGLRGKRNQRAREWLARNATKLR